MYFCRNLKPLTSYITMVFNHIISLLQMFQGQQRSAHLISSLLLEATPLVRATVTSRLLATDILPPLCEVISPSFRPVRGGGRLLYTQCIHHHPSSLFLHACVLHPASPLPSPLTPSPSPPLSPPLTPPLPPPPPGEYAAVHGSGEAAAGRPGQHHDLLQPHLPPREGARRTVHLRPRPVSTINACCSVCCICWQSFCIELVYRVCVPGVGLEPWTTAFGFLARHF